MMLNNIVKTLRLGSRVPRLELFATPETFKVPRRFRHKAKWANETAKKSQAEKALGILDGVYGNGAYAKNWKSARLALLSQQKYCAVLNNYSANFTEMDAYMREMGSLPIGDYMRKVRRKAPAVIRTDSSTGHLDLSPTYQSSVANDESSSSESVDTAHAKSLSVDDFDSAQMEMLISNNPAARHQREFPHPVVEQNEPQPEFMPASRVVHEDAEEEEDETSMEPIQSAVKESERLPLLVESDSPEVPHFLKAYVFPRGDVSRFPEPKRDLSGYGDYYLMDAASLLPVLALGVKLGDRVLDMCAAPGGKSLAMLQSMLPGDLTCNDISHQRLKRLRRVLETFCPMDTPDLQRSTRITERDGTALDWFDEPAYDKILVDAPCTTDRISVTVDENNIFSTRRTPERNMLPQTQLELLMSACSNLKKGGTVVYSTCSLSPIQNDGVVHLAVLELLREDIEMAIVDTSPYVQAFRSIYRFHLADSEASYGQTIVPHIANNFGPMYFCKLRRLA